MFASHIAQIQVTRREPAQEFEPEQAAIILARGFSEFAERIVINSMLQEPKEDSRKIRAQKRLVDSYETDERMKTIRDFMRHWNHWREFYFDLGALTPKNKGQITMIENALQFAQENAMDVNMLIACTHRGFKYRKFKPGFQHVIQHGEEYYDRHYDDVLADIDAKDYEARSLKRG